MRPPPPFLVILLSFLFAKSILLAIVIGTTFLQPHFSTIPLFYHPPIWPFGYDSSSSISLPAHDHLVASNGIAGRIVEGLFRWDTVYFIELADRREYIWEQEWAFGPGWPALIRFSAPCIIPIYYHIFC